MKKLDFLIVGSGLFGSVFAHQAFQRGHSVLILEKRDHIGGNVYTESIDGINVHRYGPHIFHTNDQFIWEFVNSFAEFNRFTYMPLAKFGKKYFNLPFNMNTFYQMWGTSNPHEVKSIIDNQRAKLKINRPANLEEQAISLVGEDVYKKLIKGYTQKQWGRDPRALPAFIIKRLPVRYTFDNNYFNDRFQGIPIGGYTKLIKGLIKGINVKLNIDFLKNKNEWQSKAKNIVFTGPIDEYYDFCFGALEYRSLKFETERIEADNYQGVAVVNYTSQNIPFTRIIEHKHFEFGKQEHTVITREFPQSWDIKKERYYPINDDVNNSIYKKYKTHSKKDKNLIFGGRLAEYKYYDMHQVIGSALSKSKRFLDKYEKGDST